MNCDHDVLAAVKHQAYDSLEIYNAVFENTPCSATHRKKYRSNAPMIAVQYR